MKLKINFEIPNILIKLIQGGFTVLNSSLLVLANTQGSGSTNSWVTMGLPFVLVIAISYFMIILPQRKRDKKMKSMLESITTGDELITIGGVCGKIVNIKDDEITIESGIEKTKIKLKSWAIKEVIKPVEA
jgi:preprotein translocase subunit YajC